MPVLLKICLSIFGCAGSSLLHGLFFFFFFKFYFIFKLYITVLDLPNSCSNWELLLGFSAEASLVAEHGLWAAWASVAAACGLSSCHSWALEHRLSSCGART